MVDSLTPDQYGMNHTLTIIFTYQQETQPLPRVSPGQWRTSRENIWIQSSTENCFFFVFSQLYPIQRATSWHTCFWCPRHRTIYDQCPSSGDRILSDFNSHKCVLLETLTRRKRYFNAISIYINKYLCWLNISPAKIWFWSWSCHCSNPLLSPPLFYDSWELEVDVVNIK